MMDPIQREHARLSLLRIAGTNVTRFGLPTRYLRTALANEGTRLTDAEVEAELVYLSDKGLLAAVDRMVSAELSCWRITANGRDYLAQATGS